MEGTSLVVKWLRSLFPLQKARVQPLLEEPDFVILHVTPYNQREKKEKNDSSSKVYFRQVKCYAQQVLINPSLSAQCVQLFKIPCTVAHPRNLPGKNTGVSYHFLLQGIFPRLLCLLH